MAHTDFPQTSSTANLGLVQIQGIGLAKQRWLQALGVATVADLARCQPKELAQQLIEKGHRTSHRDVKDWIHQAQALQADSVSVPVQSTEHQAVKVAEDVVMPDAVIQGQSLEDTKTEIADTEKRSLATFQIEFFAHPGNGEGIVETRVHHRQSDDHETWCGLAHEALQQWIMDRVDQAQTPVDDEPIAVDGEPLAMVELPRLALQQDTQALMVVVDPRHPFLPGAIASGQPFNLQLAFQLSDLQQPDLPTTSIRYRIQVKASHLETQQTRMLVDRSASLDYDSPEATYLTSPDLVLPHPGTYRLKVNLTVLNLPLTPGRFILPLVQAA